MLKSMKEWTRFGIGLKRWLLFGFLGLGLTIFGIIEILRFRFYSYNYKIYYVFLIVSGLAILYIALNEGVKNFVKLVRDGAVVVNLDSREIGTLITEHKLKVNGPKVVTVGGGTGLSTMLRGIKNYTSNVTAVVTVGDDGGGSGTLRNEMGMLPPGDIRNCLVALANTDKLMEDLMQYRFKDGNLNGQSFGNLFIAAMNGLSDNFEDAVSKMSQVLSITGKVLPVTTEDIRLCAKLKDGSFVEGESTIGINVNENNPIIKMGIIPEEAKALDAVLQSIEEAQAIVIGPGSLFTSVIPNLLIKDVAKAIKKSKALKIYVCNIMTQPGETDAFTASMHLDEIYKHADIGTIDYIIVNSRSLSDELARESYIKKGSEQVRTDMEKLIKYDIKVVEADILSVKKSTVRHDSYRLADTVMDIVIKNQDISNKDTTVDFMLNTQLKKIRDELLKDQIDK